MNVIVNIDGREAIPVRAIPFVTNWAFEPLHLAQELAQSGKRTHIEEFEGDADDWVQVWNLNAYRYNQDQGAAHKLRSITWLEVVTRLEALTTNLRSAEKTQDSLSQKWREESIKLLPDDGVFVWKDELQSVWNDVFQYTQPTIEGDNELDFQPSLLADMRDVVMAGFHSSNAAPRIPASLATMPALTSACTGGEALQVEAVPESTKADKANKTRKNKQTLEDFLMPYLVEFYRSGTYHSWKKFHKALVENAGSENSPFKAGTGKTDSLFVISRGQTLADTTLSRWMTRVRNEAAQKSRPVLPS